MILQHVLESVDRIIIVLNTTANFIVIPEGLNRESSDFQCILDSGSSPE